MRSHAERTLRIVLTTVLVAGSVAIATSLRFYVVVLLADFFWIALGSVAIIHFSIRPSGSDVALVAACTVLSCAYAFLALSLPFNARAIPAFLGLSSLAVLGVRLIWARQDERTRLTWGFVPSLIFLGMGWVTGPILRFNAARQPQVFDRFLNAFECSLGVQPAFLMGAAYVQWPWFKMLGLAAYLTLPIPIVLVYGQQLRRLGKKALPVFLALFYGGPLGTLFYNIFPAIGPRQLFLSDFPLHPHPIMEAIHLPLQAISVVGVRNAMPSMHLAWVLLAWWYSRGTDWWVRTIAMLFLIFTTFATLGTGEHFLIDLIVAAPFALFIRALFALDLNWNNKYRLSAFAVGLLGTFAWFGLLRFAPGIFWISPAVPWLLSAATIAGVSVQQSALAHAELRDMMCSRDTIACPKLELEESAAVVLD
jgi:hypothetical protein